MVLAILSNHATVLQIILTTINTGTGPNETGSVIRYQLFSVRTCINIYAKPKILWKLILVFKTGHAVAVFMNCLITHQFSKQWCPYADRQEYWNRDILLLKTRNSYLQFRHLQGLRTKLIANSIRVVSAHILFWKHVLLQGHGKGMQLLGSWYWGKNKTSISSPVEWFWISEMNTFWKIHKSVQKRLLIQNGWKLPVTS